MLVLQSLEIVLMFNSFWKEINIASNGIPKLQLRKIDIIANIILAGFCGGKYALAEEVDLETIALSDPIN